MAIYRNKASQKAAVYAYDPTTGEPVTGDAANITAQISKDGGATAATNDANPTELDATDAPGIYLFDLTQTESDADLFILSAVSSTANVLLEPLIVYTEPEIRQANAVQVSGDATAADTLELFAEALDQSTGQLDAGSLADGAITSATFAAGAINAAAIAVGALTNGKFGANAIDANVLSSTAIDEIADAVWDELTAGHAIAGSTGEALTAAGSLTDPWATALPGAYGAGTAGAIVGTNLDATVSSRASQASLDAVDANVDSILADTGTDGVVVASGSKSGYSLAAAGLDSVTVETGVNARQALAVIASSAAGVLAGAATTSVTIAAANNSGTNRITATVDEDGNRSAVTLSLPA